LCLERSSVRILACCQPSSLPAPTRTSNKVSRHTAEDVSRWHRASDPSDIQVDSLLEFSPVIRVSLHWFVRRENSMPSFLCDSSVAAARRKQDSCKAQASISCFQLAVMSYNWPSPVGSSQARTRSAVQVQQSQALGRYSFRRMLDYTEHRGRIKQMLSVDTWNLEGVSLRKESMCKYTSCLHPTVPNHQRCLMHCARLTSPVFSLRSNASSLTRSAVIRSGSARHIRTHNDSAWFESIKGSKGSTPKGSTSALSFVLGRMKNVKQDPIAVKEWPVRKAQVF
jgi:hypothetical protein